MTIDKPFLLNWRQMANVYNSGYSNWAYTNHKDYTTKPLNYIKPFLLLQKELQLPVFVLQLYKTQSLYFHL